MPNIDEKVVQMTFDNKQFEKGVAQSIKSLDDLKKALELDKMNKSLSNLEKISDTVSNSLSGLESTVSRMSSVFTPLGNLAYNALNKISNAALKAGENFLKMATGMDALSAGQQKYEKYTKAVMTITNATGKSTEEVSKVLDKLTKYTDETSYDFAEMVTSIGKFTSVGIDLERAENAMEGIASWAAKSGAGKQEANRAMYNLAQSMGMGYLANIDWKSIENANMATKEFKELAIQTAEEMGVIEKNSGITYQNFRETLKDKWLTSEVLTRVLEKYADTSTEFGKEAYRAAQNALTFTDAIDALKDAVSSGWMKSLEYMFGNLDEARVMWTDFANAIIEFSDIFTSYRNELLKGWHEQGGYNDMIEAASNIWQTFMNIVQGVGEAIQKIFPPATVDNLLNVTRSIKEASESLVNTFGLDTMTTVEEEFDTVTDKAEALDKVLERGAKNDYVRQLQEQLIKAGYRLDKYGADGIYGPETQAAMKKFQKDLDVEVTGSWDEATRAAAMTQKKFTEVSTNIRTSELKNVKEITKTITEEIDHAQELNKILTRGGKNEKEKVRGLQEQLIRLGYLTDKTGADGIYGPRTEAAVKALQHDLNVEATGAWDSVTIAAVTAQKAFVETATREETVYEQTTGLTKAMQNLQDVIEGLASIANIGKNALKTVFDIAKHFLSLFDPLVRVAWRGVVMIAEMFTELNNDLNKNNVFGNFYDKAVKFLGPFGDMILRLAAGIDMFLTGYEEFLKAGGKRNSFTSFFEYLKEATKTNTFLQGLYNLYSAVKTTIISIYNVVADVFQSIFGMLSGENGGEANGGNPKKNGVVVFLETLLKVATKVAKGLGLVVALVGYLLISLVDTIKKYLGPVAESMGGVITDLVSDFKAGKIKNVSTFFETLWASAKTTNVGKYLEDTGNKISGFFGTIKTFFMNKMPTLTSMISSKWESFKQALSFSDDRSLFDNIVSKFEWLKNKIVEIFNALKAKILGGWNFIVDLFTADENGELHIFDKISEKFKEFKEAFDKWFVPIKDEFIAAWNELIGATDDDGALKDNGALSLFDRIKGFFAKIASIDLTKYVIPAIGIVAAYTVLSSARALKNISKGVKAFGEGFSGKKKDTPGDTALKIAASIAAIALAIGLLSVVDADKAEKGIKNFLIVLGSMVVAVGLIAGIEKLTGSNASGFGAQALMLTSSIAALAVGLWLMGKVISNLSNENQLWPALKVIAGLLLELGIIEAIIAKSNKGNKTSVKIDGVLQMCLGIGVLVLAFGKMTDIIEDHSSGTIWGAVGIIAAMLAAVAGIEYLVNNSESAKGANGKFKTSISGVLSMAAAIWILVGCFDDIVKMAEESNAESMGWAAGVIGGALLEIGGLGALLNATSKGMLDSIGNALMIMSFGVSIKLVADSFADAIVKIQDVDIEIVKTFFTGVETVFGIVAGIGTILGALPTTLLVKGGVALLILAGFVAGAVAVISGVTAEGMKKLGDAFWLVSDSLEGASEMLNGVSWEAIENMETFVSQRLPELLKNIIGLEIEDAQKNTQKLQSLGANLKNFSTSIEGITEESMTKAESYAESAKKVADTLSTIKATDGVDTVLTSLGSSLKLYYESISDIGESGEDGTSLKITKVDSAMISEAFSALKDAIPMEDIKLYQSFASGGENSMYKVASGITAIGTALKRYSEDIGGIDPTKIGVANSALTTFKDLYVSLTGADVFESIVGMFTGVTKDQLSNFATNITELGSGLKDYVDATNGIDENKVKVANKTLSMMKTIDNALPKTGGLFDKLLFGSKETLGGFATNIGHLGSGIAQYANDTAAGDFTNIDASLTAVQTLAGVLNQLDNVGGLEGWLSGEKDLSVLGNGLPEVGTKLVEFEQNVGTFNPENVKAALDTFATIVGFATSIYDKINYYDVKDDSFHNAISDLGTGLKDFFREMSGLSTSTVGGGLFKEGTPIIEAFESFGTAMTNAIAGGIGEENDSGKNKIATSLEIALLKAFNEAKKLGDNIWKKIGGFIVDGIANGIDDNQQKVIDKISTLAQKAIETMKTETGVASPSKVFYWIAEQWIKGMTNSIEDNGGSVYDAFSKEANSLVSSVNDAFGKDDIFSNFLDSLKEVAEQYKETADKIVGSNEDITRSNAFKPTITKNLRKYASNWDDNEFDERVNKEAKSLLYLKNNPRTSNIFSHEEQRAYQKAVKMQEFNLTEAMLEKYGYLDPSMKREGASRYTKKTFSKAYTDYVHDLGFHESVDYIPYSNLVNKNMNELIARSGIGVEDRIRNKRKQSNSWFGSALTDEELKAAGMSVTDSLTDILSNAFTGLSGAEGGLLSNSITGLFTDLFASALSSDAVSGAIRQIYGVEGIGGFGIDSSNWANQIFGENGFTGNMLGSSSFDEAAKVSVDNIETSAQQMLDEMMKNTSALDSVETAITNGMNKLSNQYAAGSKIYLDTNVLVGQVYNGINSRIGAQAMRENRYK